MSILTCMLSSKLMQFHSHHLFPIGWMVVDRADQLTQWPGLGWFRWFSKCSRVAALQSGLCWLTAGLRESLVVCLLVFCWELLNQLPTQCFLLEQLQNLNMNDFNSTVWAGWLWDSCLSLSPQTTHCQPALTFFPFLFHTHAHFMLENDLSHTSTKSQFKVILS